MQISSESSSYTNSAYSSNGVSGLMSGMDTEGLVKSMLSGIQTKIDRQNQQKTQLEWKQESYRDVISKINSFQSKYLDLTSSTSLRTTGFFNQMKSESSNSAVKINSASSGTSQDFKIQVAQLATATKLTSGKFSTGEIKMDLDAIAANMEEHFSAPEQNITFKVGDKEVSINLCGVETGADDKPSLENMVDKINTQLQAGGIDAKLEIGDENMITVTSTVNEDEGALSISGSSNALSTLGLKAMTLGGENDTVYNSTTAADASKLDNAPPTTAEINVTLDGKTKTLSITNGTKDQVLESLTSQMKAAFGSSVTIDKQTGTITAKQGQTLSFSGDTSVLGIEQGACTRLTTSTKLSDLGIEGDNYTFKINNKEFEFTADNTVNDVINKINSSGVGAKMVYNSLSDSFTLTSTETGEGFALTVEGNLGEKFFKDAETTEGQNAIVNIDGVTVERTSNNISYNGVSMELRGVTGDYFDESGALVENEDGTLAAADGTEDKAAEITANRDTSKVMETIKSFVEDYNKLIEELNKLTHQKKSYKEYAPLTEAQKKEMSESEITAWEKKAHEGLLSGDSDINKFLSSMRSTIYSTTSGGTSLSMFGIDTSSNWKDYGKLEIDEKKLTEFLSSDAEAVISTFTSVANGLNDACKAAANTSSASPGSLVALAGVEGRVSEKNNTIKKQLDAIAEKIKNLQSVYDQRKERYWKQFNAMEQVIGNMSSTSSYLTSMLGY
ncbi:MAG: flagellar filament capping protein FliD [Ruminococcus sp.]|nr:flagellar filament capping protein FliD [Ruminococcus sp.]